MTDPFSSDMCKKCKQLYSKLNIDGITSKPFMPNCRGDIRLLEGNTNVVDPFTKAKAIVANPTTWVPYELDKKLRWYQEEILCCTARQKAVRAGRRVGKTWSLTMGALHRMANIDYYKVIVIAPYQNQIDIIFNACDELTNKSRTLCDKIKRRVKSPQIIELSNGSTMRGFPSGVKSGARSDKVRGQDADEIFIDEVDYLPEEDIDAIIAILASNRNTRIVCSSTPTGLKSKFWGMCTNKNQMWKEFHYTSMMSPEWTDETEAILRSMYCGSAWDHEILAEFGDFAEGAFPTKKLYESLRNYSLKDCKPQDKCIYAMGVDWNEHPTGIHIVIVEFDTIAGTFKTVDKVISNDQEFTQHRAITDILEVYRRWHPRWLWADAGAGGMQIESLERVSLKHPELKMRGKIHGVLMQSTELIKDPITKQDVKKQVKALMVDLCIRRVEMGMCIFPRDEDTEKNLVDQLRNFKVERVNASGMPVYSQGVDHTAIAWMVAMYALLMNLTDIKRVVYCTDVGLVAPKNKSDVNPNQTKNNVSSIIGSRELAPAENAWLKTFRKVQREEPRPDMPGYDQPKDIGFIKMAARGSRLYGDITSRSRI